MHTYKKAFLTLWSYDVRTSQLLFICQAEATKGAPEGVYIGMDLFMLLYIHRRGVFGVARFDRQGNAKAFTSWNGQQSGLHVLFYLYESHC